MKRFYILVLTATTFMFWFISVQAIDFDSLQKVAHGGIDIFEGDVITRNDLTLINNDWTFTFDWPHSVSNVNSFLAIARGTFGDLEGGIPQEGVNYGVNGQPWSAGSNVISKNINLPALGELTTTASLYTAIVAEKNLSTDTTQDIMVWFASSGATGTPPLNHTFLTFEYTAESNPINLDSIESVWHGGKIIEDGDVIRRDDIAIDSPLWQWTFNWPNSVDNQRAFFFVFRGTFGDLEGGIPQEGVNYSFTNQVWPAGTSTIAKQIALPTLANSSTTPLVYTTMIAELDPKYLDSFDAGEQINWFASGGSSGISPLKYALLTFEFKGDLEDCCSNVAFLPGLQGSRLYQNGVKLWEPTLTTNNEDIQPLFLNPDGTSVNSDITTRDIVDEGSGINIYKGFIKFMDDALVSAGIINEWEALPYDWRLPLNQILSSGKKIDNSISYLQATSSPFIVQEIRRLAETSQNGKVTIIAHSNGGLLAKALLQSLEDSNDPLLGKIDQLILVAVPQIGTPKAVEGLLHGSETQLGGGLLLDEEHAREFGENMQSAYTLLPSREYFNKIASPVITFATNTSRLPELQDRAGSTITTANDLYTFLLGDGTRVEPASNDEEYPNVLKPNLLENSKNIHDTTLDTWIPPQGLEVIQIAGWGSDTLSGIEYSCRFLTCRSLSTLDRDIQFTSEGDGTVVFSSAVFLEEDEYFVNLEESNRGFRKNRDHANILEIDSLQTVVKELVQGILDNNNLPNFISTTKPTESNPRKRLILRSPVTINIFDSTGLHTGPLENTSSDLRRTEARIPNSYYREIAGHKYLGLDGSDTYRIELKGENLGTFTLEINDVFNDEIIESNVFIDIPITQNTRGELTITQSTTTTLVLDIDGDGNIDITISPREEIDISVSLEVLIGVLETLDIHKGLKKELIKKLEKTIKEFNKGKTEKAIKEFNKVTEKLEKEIEKNAKQENNENDNKHNEHKDNEKKEHKHRHHHQDDEKVKISTEDAQKLIEIIENILGGVV